MKNLLSLKFLIPISAIAAITFSFQSNESDSRIIDSAGSGNTNISGDGNNLVEKAENYNFYINGETLILSSLDDLNEVQKKVVEIEENLEYTANILETYKQDIDNQKELELINHEKENVAAYVANHQYSDAIDLLQNSLCKMYPSNVELNKLLLDTIYEYLEHVTQEVDQLLQLKNYIEARNLVNTVEKILGNSSEDYLTMEHLKNKVESHQDVQLGSLKVVTSSGNIVLNPAGDLTKGSLSDHYEYSNDNLIKKSSHGDSSIEFYLGSKYTMLEVTIAISDESPSKQNPASVTFIGDGGNILYTSGDLTRSSDVINALRIDVSNQDRLTIVIKSSDSNYSVYPIIANPILYT